MQPFSTIVFFFFFFDLIQKHTEVSTKQLTWQKLLLVNKEEILTNCDQPRCWQRMPSSYRMGSSGERLKRQTHTNHQACKRSEITTGERAKQNMQVKFGKESKECNIKAWSNFIKWNLKAMHFHLVVLDWISF